MKKFLRNTFYAMLMTPSFISGVLTTSDNHRIAYYHYKQGHHKVIIIAPGFYNSKDAVLLQKLKDRLIDTYDVIMFDFRGHGASSGVFYWTSKEGLDLRAIVEYAKNDYAKIGLIAFSLGASNSIDLLTQTDVVGSLVAISAVSDFSKIDYKFWKLDFKGDLLYTFGKEGRIGRGVRVGPFWLKKPKPIDEVDRIKCPVLYIHGDKDWVIGYRHSQELYAKTKAKREIIIIKNGPHAEYLLKDDSRNVVGLIMSWFKTTLENGVDK